MKLLLSVFVLCLAFNIGCSHSLDTHEKFADSFIAALKQPDARSAYNLLRHDDPADALVNGADDDLKEDEIQPVAINGVRLFEKLYKQLTETRLPLASIKQVGLDTKPLDGIDRVYLHITLGGYHAVILYYTVQTMSGYKLTRGLELKTPTQADKILREQFQAEGVPLLSWSGTPGQEIECDNDCTYSNRYESGTNDRGSYKQINYLVRDTLYGYKQCYEKEEICVIKRFYKSGIIRDSAVHKPVSGVAMEEYLKPGDFNIYDAKPGQATVVHYTSLYTNGRPRVSMDYLTNDTTRRRTYYYIGTPMSDEVRAGRKLVSERIFNIIGEQTTYRYFYEKEAVENYKELETFPAFKDVFRQFYNGVEIRPEVTISRRPTGWVITLLRDSSEYLYWSFKEQHYQQLPQPVFRLGVSKFEQHTAIPDERMHPAGLTIFYGYPGADEATINLIRKKSERSLTDLGVLQYIYHSQCKAALIRDTPDMSAATIQSLAAFKNISSDILKNGKEDKASLFQKSRTYYLSAELYWALFVQQGKEGAQKHLPLPVPARPEVDEYLSAYFSACKQNAVVFSSQAFQYACFQQARNFRKDVKLADLSWLRYSWYRAYLEKIIAPGIFKQESSLYDVTKLNELVNVYSASRAAPVDIKTFLDRIKNTGGSDPLKNVPEKITLGKNKETAIDLNQQEILQYLGVGGLELLLYLEKQAGKVTLYDDVFLEPFWEGNKVKRRIMTDGPFLTEFFFTGTH